VNAHVEDEDGLRIEQPDYSALEAGQLDRLGAFKGLRSAEGTRAALSEVRTVATSEDNLMPVLIDAVKVGVTLGEISDVLRDAWSTYDG